SFLCVVAASAVQPDESASTPSLHVFAVPEDEQSARPLAAAIGPDKSVFFSAIRPGGELTLRRSALPANRAAGEASGPISRYQLKNFETYGTLCLNPSAGLIALDGRRNETAGVLIVAFAEQEDGRQYTLREARWLPGFNLLCAVRNSDYFVLFRRSGERTGADLFVVGNAGTPVQFSALLPSPMFFHSSSVANADAASSQGKMVLAVALAYFPQEPGGANGIYFPQFAFISVDLDRKFPISSRILSLPPGRGVYSCYVSSDRLSASYYSFETIRVARFSESGEPTGMDARHVPRDPKHQGMIHIGTTAAGLVSIRRESRMELSATLLSPEPLRGYVPSAKRTFDMEDEFIVSQSGNCIVIADADESFRYVIVAAGGQGEPAPTD
ncbi:MAG: hypothetical protein AAF907_06800, partial [Planctomycetota bacterium]